MHPMRLLLPVVHVLLLSTLTNVIAFGLAATRRFGGRRLSRLLAEAEPVSSERPTIPVVGVVAPLVYRGPYPCLGLEFPHIVNKTSSGSGVSLEFVLGKETELSGIYLLVPFVPWQQTSDGIHLFSHPRHGCQCEHTRLPSRPSISAPCRIYIQRTQYPRSCRCGRHL